MKAVPLHTCAAAADFFRTSSVLSSCCLCLGDVNFRTGMITQECNAVLSSLLNLSLLGNVNYSV